MGWIVLASNFFLKKKAAEAEAMSALEKRKVVDPFFLEFFFNELFGLQDPY